MHIQLRKTDCLKGSFSDFWQFIGKIQKYQRVGQIIEGY